MAVCRTAFCGCPAKVAAAVSAPTLALPRERERERSCPTNFRRPQRQPETLFNPNPERNPQNPSQVWLVTGASGGLGLALVKALLAAGHRVATTTRNADKLRAEVGDNENLLALTMALTDEADIRRGIAAITERFGRIDVTVNNAGYILVGAIEELSDAEIRANFDINVFGMMNVIRAVMPVYRAQKSGRFLNISSISGSVTDPGQAIYSASKAAVIMLTEAVDDEGRDFNVRATAVCHTILNFADTPLGSL